VHPSARFTTRRATYQPIHKGVQRCKRCESLCVRDSGWEIAHGAVSRRLPISLYTMVARTGGYTHDVGGWDLSIVQGQFLSRRANLIRNFCIDVWGVPMVAMHSESCTRKKRDTLASTRAISIWTPRTPRVKVPGQSRRPRLGLWDAAVASPTMRRPSHISDSPEQPLPCWLHPPHPCSPSFSMS
jgi:hypothetical protein